MKVKKHLPWIIVSIISIAVAAILIAANWLGSPEPPEATEPTVSSVQIEVQKPKIEAPEFDAEESKETPEATKEPDIPKITLVPEDEEQSTAVNSSPIVREDVQLPAMDAPEDFGK